MKSCLRLIAAQLHTQATNGTTTTLTQIDNNNENNHDNNDTNNLNNLNNNKSFKRVSRRDRRLHMLSCNDIISPPLWVLPLVHSPQYLSHLWELAEEARDVSQIKHFKLL